MGTTGYMSVVLIANMVGFVAGAYLTDILGRRLNTIIFAVFSAVSIFVYTHVQLTNHQMLIFGFFMGLGSPGVFSNIGAWLTELFPSNVRATGLGFAYNVGRGVGALFPAVVGILSERIGLGSAIGIFGGGAYASVVIAAILLPETRGRDLHTLESSAVVNPQEPGLKNKVVEAGRD
jgi:MFS family permease